MLIAQVIPRRIALVVFYLIFPCTLSDGNNRQACFLADGLLCLSGLAGRARQQDGQPGLFLRTNG
jgi:hypothetical protein